MKTTAIYDTLPEQLTDIVDQRVSELEDSYAEINPSVFTGANQWLIRCDGTTIWCSCETNGTWFDDDNTMASGPQQWDRSSYERSDDETDEEYDERFAADSRPEFPEAEVRERVATRLLAVIVRAVDDLDW